MFIYQITDHFKVNEYYTSYKKAITELKEIKNFDDVVYLYRYSVPTITKKILIDALNRWPWFEDKIEKI